MFSPLNYSSVCRLNRIRTYISSFVVKYSHPLNYKPSWLTPGIEPCSPQPQCDALPNKLKPTSDIGVGFEPTSSESDSEMLPLHHPTISIAGRTRTCILSVPGGVSSQLECCYKWWYCYHLIISGFNGHSFLEKHPPFGGMLISSFLHIILLFIS